MNKYPIFYDVNDTFVKIDYDKETDEVFGETAGGHPYPLGKTIEEGSPITQEEFNRKRNSLSASE